MLLGGGDGADGGENAFDLADIVPALPGIKAHLSTVKQCCTFYSFLPDGGRFSMKHKIWDGCGIPDGETIVMTGSGSTQSHTHVTRYATECATSTALIAQRLFV